MTLSYDGSRAPPFNVLVFPGGTEIGLEIRGALALCKDFRLFSAGADVSNHAPFAFSNHDIVPAVGDDGWLDSLNEVVRRHSIDFIIPAHDDAVLALAANAPAIGAIVVTSPLETCAITRSKLATYRTLAGCVAVPRVFSDHGSIDRFPVFIKPDRGQGSQHTFLARDQAELAVFLRSVPDPLVMEYLPGNEFTVDCFSDRDRGLLFCSGRTRTRVRAGISMNSSTSSCSFYDIGMAINRLLTFHGAWFFQVKMDLQGTLKLLEVAPRIAGTMALHRVKGVNFPLLSIYEQLRIPVKISASDFNVELDRALVNRYRHGVEYDTVYVDLDDTLVVDGIVNTMLVQLLYQCINSGKRVCLVTRHKGDVITKLTQHRLQSVFDEIIQVNGWESKRIAISGRSAIFIDDSFRERCDVAASGIPTFDSTMIEMLIDERV